MQPVIGREEEQGLLESAFNSHSPELIALYGRRRVGKTYLIRNTFQGREDTIFFTITGMKNGRMSQQLKNFVTQLGNAFYHAGARLEAPKNWFDALDLLAGAIKASSVKKIMLFFDEFPWMVTRKSELLVALEYFWNEHGDLDPRVKLIICGSSAGWILKKIVNNRGAFYNRVTKKMHLEPFNLYQTKKYLAYLKISLTDKQIAHIYMVLGGIPFYLSRLQKGLSAVENIAHLAFNKDSFLLEEFDNLYATLFDGGKGHIDLARAIAKHRCGINQEDLAREIATLSSGGTMVQWLKDLEQAGFIQRFRPFLATKKGIYYKMVDEYSLFYFYWIEPIKGSLQAKGIKKGYWESQQQSPEWYSWSGYAFESLCYKHILEIMHTLKLSDTAIAYTWRYVPSRNSKEEGAQIDLLFDRKDDTITICEMKYTESPFVIDKSYAQILNKRIEIFKHQTKTRKNVLLAMISSSGLKKTLYSEEMVSGLVKLEDFFKRVRG